MELTKYQELAMRTAKIMPLQQMLLHGALGIGSEHGELCQLFAPLTSPDDLTRVPGISTAVSEEIGDSFWFSAYLRNALGAGFNWELLRQRAFAEISHGSTLTTCILECGAEAGEVQTIIKAHVFYGRELDILALQRHLNRLAVVQILVLTFFQLGFKEVLEANITKLAKRYPEKFTEEAALLRADKAASVDDFTVTARNRDFSVKKQPGEASGFPLLD